jgi:hypothetical protein
MTDTKDGYDIGGTHVTISGDLSAHPELTDALREFNAQQADIPPEPQWIGEEEFDEGELEASAMVRGIIETPELMVLDLSAVSSIQLRGLASYVYDALWRQLENVTIVCTTCAESVVFSVVLAAKKAELRLCDTHFTFVSHIQSVADGYRIELSDPEAFDKLEYLFKQDGFDVVFW